MIFKDLIAKFIEFDNDDSGLLAINVQDAIDELAASGGSQPFTSLADPAIDSIDTAMIDLKGGVVITLTAAGNDQTLPTPTDIDVKHKFTIINNDTSSDNIDIIGVVTVTLQPGESVEFIYDGDAWVASEAEGLWLDDGTALKAQKSARSIDLQLKGLLGTGYIDFDTSGVALLQEGRLRWDSDAGTLVLGMPGGNVALQIGQENYLPGRPKNDEGSQIDNGMSVYISGATGSVAEVKLATSSDFENANKTIAIATEDVTTNQRGYYTTFGIVRDIKTNYATWAEGDVIYLGSSPGELTNVLPVAPNAIVEVGYILRVHATEGKIFVNINSKRDLVVREITKEPSGFTDPGSVILTGDGTARTITLTGTVNFYYRGVPVSELVTSYVSPVHNNDTNPYFLIYDGSTVLWVTVAAFDFSTHQLIAFTFYAVGTNERVYIREPHGLMPWQAHKELHEVIGTYRTTGGVMGDFVLSSTTVADRRPSVSSSVINDEDLPTTNPVLAANGPYTIFNLTSTGLSNFDTSEVDIVPLSTNQPFWNEFTGGAWQQTLMSASNYMSIWLMAIPVTSDTESQLYRYIWVQGQEQNSLLVNEEAVNANDVSLGDIQGVVPEFVFIGRIIVRFIGANWQFIKVEAIDGTRFSQSSSPQGNFLSNVTSDSTLSGDGTASDPLGVVTSVTNKSASDTAELIDAFTVIEYTNSTNDYSFTLPQNSEVAFPIGTHLEIRRTGSGEITITKGTGATFRGVLGDVNVKIDGQDGLSVFIEKTATNTWLLSGAVKAV